MLFQKKQIIDKYTVAFPHKQGSYAETYRVRDNSGKLLFLKLICYSLLNAAQFDDKGNIIEVEVAKALCHNNLCGFVDAGSLILNGQKYAFIVTEFISSETVAEKMNRDRLISVYDAKEIAKSILNALSFIHSLPVPILHNEVTPQNAMINLVKDLSSTKLIDFGHARFLNQPPSKDDIKNINPFYMAPERFNGVCCVQSDLYSVGVMLYQMIFGILPWYFDISKCKRNEIVNTLAEKRNSPLRIPNLDIFELDEQLINIMAKSMSLDTRDRFQSAEEFIKALDGVIKVEPSKHKEADDDEPTSKTKIERKIPKGEGFAAIAGMQELKEIMRNEIIEAINNKEEYAKYGLSLPNGMLLYGPPGCGKTFFAKNFAAEVGFNYIEVKGGDLKSKWVNGSQENIDKMFKDAEEAAPTIIYIDEMNEIAPNRSSSDVHEMSKSAVNAMLVQMDRTGEKGIFIIGSTNFPNEMDPAILRAGRLDRKYYIGPPDKEAREEMFKIYMKKRPYDFGIDYSKLADLTEGYVLADLKLIIDKASLAALRKHSKITQDILEEFIGETLPSLSPEELQKYERVRAEMKREKKNDERPRIGF